MSAISAPFNAAGTGLRHMMDVNVSFGVAGDRLNARNDYRTEYSASERTGAGIGTAFGVAVPAMATVALLKRGVPVPGAPSGVLAQGAGKAAAVGVGAGLTAIGARKVAQITQDDGHLGAVGAAAGIVGGTLAGFKVGSRISPKFAPLISGGAAIAGGIAGYQGGKAISVGEGNIGTPHAHTARTSDELPGALRDMGRGALLHFSETGPTSQGVSFQNAWDLRETYETEYSNAERTGAMLGDLGAVGILGGGALATVGALSKGGLTAGTNQAMQTLGRSSLMTAAGRLGTMGVAGVGAGAAAIAGLTAMKEHEVWAENHGETAGKVAAGATVAATVGLGAALTRSQALKGMAAGPRIASGALAAAALVGALSAARVPAQQFMNDARSAHSLRGDANPLVTYGTAGAGALGGGKAGLAIATKLGGSVGGWKGTAIKAGGAIGGALLGGATGYGLSATMPSDLSKVGISTGVGAAAGAGAGLLLGGVGMKAGAVGGAALGLAASGVLRGSEDAATPGGSDVDELAPGPIVDQPAEQPAATITA